MHSVVEPNAWVALKLPTGNLRLLQITPNTTISLGKYGSFSSNLILHRPYHLTYELQDKLPGESHSRLCVVPTSELYADIFAEEAAEAGTDDADNVITTADGVEYSLVDAETDAVVVRSNRETIDDNARQTLTTEEIEALRKEGAGAGKEIIAKLLLSHTAIEEKTAFSLAKYKLLKTKKYIRRFSVAPIDPLMLGGYLLDDKDVGNRIMEMREEMIALVGCWANVHYGGADTFRPEVHFDPMLADGPDAYWDLLNAPPDQEPLSVPLGSGRWLCIDDSGGLLVAAMAERMGILYSSQDVEEEEDERPAKRHKPSADDGNDDSAQPSNRDGGAQAPASLAEGSNSAAPSTSAPTTKRRRIRHHPNDLHVPYSLTNTLTVLHSNNQPNLAYLSYWGFDATNPSHASHPLNTHLLSLNWLQLLHPEDDLAYSVSVPTIPDDTLATWKTNRRGNYHRKRRRWARTRHIVNATRGGEHSGLVVASTMDPVSILRHTLPLLAGGAPVAIYSPTMEPLSALQDCFSTARRIAWAGRDAPPAQTGKTVEELERWEGSPEFPLNPTLLLGTGVQTSRARKWQVLPGRTHPMMTSRGGAEGYVFTGWKARPAEGKVEARGKFMKRGRGGVQEGVDESG